MSKEDEGKKTHQPAEKRRHYARERRKNEATMHDAQLRTLAQEQAEVLATLKKLYRESPSNTRLLVNAARLRGIFSEYSRLVQEKYATPHIVTEQVLREKGFAERLETFDSHSWFADVENVVEHGGADAEKTFFLLLGNIENNFNLRKELYGDTATVSSPITLHQSRNIKRQTQPSSPSAYKKQLAFAQTEPALYTQDTHVAPAYEFATTRREIASKQLTNLVKEEEELLRALDERVAGGFVTGTDVTRTLVLAARLRTSLCEYARLVREKYKGPHVVNNETRKELAAAAAIDAFDLGEWFAEFEKNIPWEGPSKKNRDTMRVLIKKIGSNLNLKTITSH